MHWRKVTIRSSFGNVFLATISRNIAFRLKIMKYQREPSLIYLSYSDVIAIKPRYDTRFRFAKLTTATLRNVTRLMNVTPANDKNIDRSCKSNRREIFRVCISRITAPLDASGVARCKFCADGLVALTHSATIQQRRPAGCRSGIF